MPACCSRLLSDAEFGNDGTVTLDVVFHEVVKKTAALTDHFEEAHSGVIVLLVDLEMFGELGDALSKDGDLDFGGAGVTLVSGVFGDDAGFLFLGYHCFCVLSFIILHRRSNGAKGSGVCRLIPKPGRRYSLDILSHENPIVKCFFADTYWILPKKCVFNGKNVIFPAKP